MYINEKKIISAIQMCIKEGEKEFARGYIKRFVKK